MNSVLRAFSVFFLVLSFSLGASAQAQRCGKDFSNATCDNDLCCSSGGYCGYTDAYCGPGCQSQCHDLPSFVSETLYNEMFPHQNECPSQGFYTYAAFIMGALHFKSFANVIDEDDDITRKREVAAFLAQTSYATSVETEVADPYAWGYCILSESNPTSDYCDQHYDCPKQYYGRGPIQLQWNYNYDHCGEVIGKNLLQEPDLLTEDSVISFLSAYWRWMTPKTSLEPSCHDAMAGKWHPSETDVEEGRILGFGLTTNILNGEAECGKGPNEFGEKRIGFYKRYCDLLGVSYGENLDCYYQKPFNAYAEPALVKTM